MDVHESIFLLIFVFQGYIINLKMCFLEALCKKMLDFVLNAIHGKSVHD